MAQKHARNSALNADEGSHAEAGAINVVEALQTMEGAEIDMLSCFNGWIDRCFSEGGEGGQDNYDG
jgi:hypothetical protein